MIFFRCGGRSIEEFPNLILREIAMRDVHAGMRNPYNEVRTFS
jgi:hypothetical protein